jgi:hypothetical protein
MTAWSQICDQNIHACPPGFESQVSPWAYVNSAMSGKGLATGSSIILVGSAFAATQGRANASSEDGAEGSGENMVEPYRNVDAREFDSIAETGKFSTGPGQMEGKWFATTGEDAEQWGQLLNAGDGVTVMTRVPASVAEQLYYNAGKLDGVGSAYYADGDQLDLINGSMDPIEVFP